ncbi:hypothetical protein SAMN05444172_9006 [Burkholderia sp. GAS332]|nr:hypothetical protein SAMN05444172_9006 [Burkholderia sp. GAS332]
MVHEHGGEHESQWMAIASIATKMCCSGETLRSSVGQDERNRGLRADGNTPDQERLKALEREVRELCQVNEILRKASAYFVQAELDRRPK